MQHTFRNLKPFAQYLNESAIDDVLSNMLRDMYSRTKEQFDDYVAENNLEEDAQDDFEYEFEHFLSNEIGIDIDSDNMVTFDKYDPSFDRIVGDYPILLYHYTSSSLVPDIMRDGLQTGIHQTNPHENSYSGVYLTCEYSGSAVNGYCHHARNQHEGDAVRLHVKVYLHELEPDPDDADIASGDCQFTIPAVSPDRILKVSLV